MSKVSQKTVSLLISFMLILSINGVIAVSAEGEEFVIAENGNYIYNEKEPIVVKSGVVANLTLSGVVIESLKNAITIEDKADVTINLDGVNSLQANPEVVSAGIFVPKGAKLTIKGTGTLDVTGGKHGAAIGSIENVVSGMITIDEGIINATGGKRGAGIGSGYHTSAGDTVINGGTITAIGTECAAGIGNGYGTSGGGEGKVGTFSGGNITINGGKIYASSFPIDFTKVDPLEPECLVEYDNNSFAAGIGGGYGSSSGNIKITGGDIIALGSSGGAGIGSGRGTSSAGKYDKNTFFTNIDISGNAKIIAMATDDVRNYKGGGAAIGTGRGTHTGGTISISGNADVTAIASPFSAAIGAGSNPSPVDGKTIPVPENIKIAKGVKLYAVSDGMKYAVDTACGTKKYDGITANIQQILFDSSVLDVDDSTEFTLCEGENEEKSITVPKGMKSVAVTVDKSTTYYLTSDNLYGIQKDEKFEYVNTGTLDEHTCVDLREFTPPEDDEEPIIPGNPVEIVNEYAYIFGRSEEFMNADESILRGEACAVLYRLLKQNDALGEFKYNSSSAPAFSDLEGRWDRSAIEYMTSIGVYAKNPEVTIGGSSAILRGEAFKLFALSLGFTNQSNLKPEKYASILFDKGYISGDENGELNLDRNITRAEFCKIYNMIIGRDKMPLIDTEGNEVTAETYGFVDVPDDAWYFDIILKATSAYTDGRIDLSKRVMRNQIDDYE